jgi:hypothetical protein
MPDQRHDLIARLTTDSIDMGTYDMAMPADRDPTPIHAPACSHGYSTYTRANGEVRHIATGRPCGDAGRATVATAHPEEAADAG